MKTLLRIFFILSVVFAIASAQTSPLRFAWLSDTHVGSRMGAEDLSSSVHDINAMNDVAFVILSGDVTEMGSNAQLETAKTILDSLRKPYYVIPGNHDTKWSASGCTKFSSLWGNDKFAFTYGGYGFVGIHQGPIMKMGDGHFPPEDLRWLDSSLAALVPKSQPIFFVTHYPLDSSIDNWYLVTERLKRWNTQAVLVGHGHTNKIMNFEGLPAVMGRSNLRAGSASSGYTLVDVRGDTASFSERTPGTVIPGPWYRMALGRRNFPAVPVRFIRPDSSINQEYPGIVAEWTVNAHFTIASTPAVLNDDVVVGSGNGCVCCYARSNGSLKWSFRTGGTVYSSPAVSDDRVVVGSSDGNIYCLDLVYGSQMWKVRTEAPVVAAVTISSGTVYVGGSDGVFRAIDLKTGRPKWEFRTIGGFVEAKPLIYEDKVIFGAWDTFLYALSLKDGALIWKWSNGNTGALYSPAACWPVAAHGKVFIVAPDRFMTALSAETGKTIWRSNLHQVRECVGISVDGERVYARCMTDTVIAFSSSADSPEEIWRANCRYGYDIDPSMPMERDGIIYFGAKNGFVYALNARSGTILWRHRIGVTIVSTPVPLENGRVLVSDLDGTISLLTEKH